MRQTLKKWWRTRQAKHYLKNHWHLYVDIAFLIIILILSAALVIIKQYKIPSVDTSPVGHVRRENAIPGTLLISSSLSSKNLYSGRPLTFKIKLENASENNVQTISLVPKIITAGFSLSKLENLNSASNIKIEGQKLILESLAPGASEEAEISATINAEPQASRSMSWALGITYIENNQTYASGYNLNDLKLVTDLKISAEGYYNSLQGDQLGSGPIPPMLGFPTNYWIFFEVDNKNNDLHNLAVSAKLPAGVTLSNHKSLTAGDLSYNESQKRLTWLVDNVNDKIEHYRAGFEIQLLPTLDQLNTAPLLLDNISYFATDVYTGEKLSGKLEAVNTQLPFDIINRGQGLVAK